MHEVRSLGEFVELTSFGIRPNGGTLWFRGHRKADWGLRPLIHRDYTNDQELDFCHRFRSRAGIRYGDSPEYDNMAAWLSLMQHYGLPTRLLDWTRSPLVALYFALEKYTYDKVEPEDACVWVLDPHKLNASQRIEIVTASIVSLRYRKYLKPAFYKGAKEPGKVVAAMAFETDIRMFVQQGCFTIHSRREPLNELRSFGRFLSKVIIPKEHVERIATQLYNSGFRKGDIFPDLQNLADELRAKYPPTP